MPALSKYGAAGAQSKKYSRRKAEAIGYQIKGIETKETAQRLQASIDQSLKDVASIAKAATSIRQEVQFGEEVEGLYADAPGIEKTTEKGFLGLPKTSYTDVDTGKTISAMDIYVQGKFGEGTETYDRWFGEEAIEGRRIKRQEVTPEQRERGLEALTPIQEADIAAQKQYQGKRKEVYKDLTDRGLIEYEEEHRYPRINVDPNAFETVEGETKGIPATAVERGDIIEETAIESGRYAEGIGGEKVWQPDEPYSASEMEKMQAARVKSTMPVKGVIEPDYQDFIIEPQQQAKILEKKVPTLTPQTPRGFGPGRKTKEERLNLPAPMGSPVPQEAIEQMKAPDYDLFGEGEEPGFSSVEIERLIGAESSGLPGAVSSSGRIGAMQIWESTAADPGYGVSPVGKADLLDPQSNINFGKKYLEAMYKRFGSKEKALAAYILGPGAAQRDYFPQMGAADPDTRVRKHLRGKTLPKDAPKPETFGSVELYIDRILGRSPLHKSYGDEESILANVRQRYGGMY